MRKTNVNDITYNYAEMDLALICEEKYSDLSPRDILVFTLLKNQESLSINSVRLGKMDYVDKEGNIFVRIAQEKLSKILKISEPTLRSSLKLLQKNDLIEVVKKGKNQCARIYVGTPESNITYSDYVKKIGLEIEAEREKKEIEKDKKNDNVKSKNVKDINKDMKKDLPAATDKPSNQNKNSKIIDTEIVSSNTNDSQEGINVNQSNNLEIIKNAGIEIPIYTSKKIKNDIGTWDTQILIKCIGYMDENRDTIGKFNVNYLAKIYKNPVFLKNKDKVKRTNFHNFTENFDKYSDDEMYVISRKKWAEIDRQ